MSLSIRIFDTILSSDKSGDSASRNSADFWKAFCLSSGWSFNYERVHSLSDIEFFFCQTKIKEQVVIFSGHGDFQNGLILSNNEVLDGNHNFVISTKNQNKIILFSSCSIGKNDKLSNQLKVFLMPNVFLHTNMICMIGFAF